MHRPGNASENRTAYFDEIAHPRQAALHCLHIKRIAGANFCGNARHKGVGEELAGFVGDVDVLDALNLDELIDERLQGRQVAI